MEHLNQDQILRYAGRQMPPSELLAADDHLADCDACRAQLIDDPTAANPDALETFLQLDAEPHLSYSQLESYVDHTMRRSERAMTDEHLATCEACVRRVDELDVLASVLGVRPSAVRAKQDMRIPFWRILGPAFAVLAIALIAGIWLFRNQPSVDELAQVVPTPVAIESPAIVDSEPPVADNDTIQPDEPSVILTDGSGHIEIDSNGKLQGVDDLEFEWAAARALTSGDVTIAGDERRLRGSAGTLMGGEKEGVPFALSGPVGAVIESSRPTLKWRQLAGAESYRVTVFDENFTQVAASPDLRATSWQVAKPLGRGAVYRWQVTAVRNGEEVRSPVRPAPDARFKVIDADSARRLSNARSRHANSHLILGLAYAEAGLLADAEREFRALVQRNPDSTVARRLLDKVRAAR